MLSADPETRESCDSVEHPCQMRLPDPLTFAFVERMIIKRARVPLASARASSAAEELFPLQSSPSSCMICDQGS